MIKLNGEEIKPTKFPDGTSQVVDLNTKISSGITRIELDFENESEIIQLLQILNYCEVCHSLSRGKEGNVDLYLPFMPYGRQDKSLTSNYFGKVTFMRLLGKHQCLNKITTLDEHSNEYNLDIVENKQPIKEINNSLLCCQPDLICYPDAGAQKRYKKLITLEDFSSCSFTKERDQKTGYIKRLYLNELVDIQNKTILIIDDICDGGMTFKLTAERLKELGAKEVHLYVTHGIFSKGLETLRESGIDRIFTRKGEH